MKERVTNYLHRIDLKNIEYHDMFISLHTSEEYNFAIETLNEWIIDGSENHIDKKNKEKIEDLIPGSLIFSSWILTRILKTGKNDLVFNRIKVKQVLKELQLIEDINIQSYSDFIFTGLGMCITHLTENLRLTNEQSCKLLISACLIALEQMIDYQVAS